MSNDNQNHLEQPYNRVLPSVIDVRAGGGVAPPLQQVNLGDTEPEEATVPLTHYLWVIRRHIWKVTAFVAASVVATVVVSSRLTPVFESTATVYVDRQAPAGIVGQESQMLAPSFDSEQFVATQMRLIQSDAVLRPVVQRYRLLDHETQLEGEEAYRDRAVEAPYILKKMKVTRPPNTYLLQISYRSPDAQLAADVVNGIAESYIAHTYNIRIKSSTDLARFMEKQLDEVRAKMENSSQRLSQLEKELNVVNPEEKTSIQTARLLQLNTAYTAAQGDRVQKQAAYDATKSGQLEALQVSGQGESLRKLHERVNEANEKFAQVKTHFGANHPEYRRAAAQQREMERQFEDMRQNIRQRVEVEFREAMDREKRLEAEVALAKVEMDRINARSGEYQKVRREAETDKKLYEELVRKIRESNINAGFQNNTVRVADRGRPGWKPVFPKIPLNAALAFVFSLLVAVGAAILSDTLDSTVRDPEQAARMLNTHVIGTLPAVRDIKQLTIPVMLGTGPNGAMQVYKGRSQDRQISTYEEAVRTLRSSVLLTDFDRRIRTLLFTSATAGEGKSTTASHLAFVHAEQKKRTLLVDCDLRRPSQHKIFGVPSNLGLSNVLNGEIGWRQALIRLETNPNLDILTAGPPSRRAADLVGPMIQGLVEEMSKEYDLIVLDGPPLLGFAESLQMASSADGVIVVTRAGETSRKAVGAAMNTLARLRANAVGLVLNQVKKHHSDHYYYYGYYGKYYKRYQADEEETAKTVDA